MINHDDMDRQIAEIIGLKIVPLFVSKTDSTQREYEDGCLYEEPYRNRLYDHPSKAFTDAEEWSPSTDAGDAIAALEAWQKQSHGSWLLGGEGSEFYTCDLIRHGKHDIELHGKSVCEVACQAIIAAQETSRG